VTDTLSAAQARRIALAAQGFSRARPASVSARHIHRVMDRLGVLQIDSVNVFARSHYMPLFSRLGAYEPALFDRVFHSRTTHYVEYMAHEATFIPIEDWPLWRFRMDHFRARWAAPDSWMSTNTRTLRWVQDELRARGPLRPADLRDDAPRERGTWWDWDDVKLALEHLWRTGDVAISGRKGFERTYALAEQVIPDAILSQHVPREDAIRELTPRGTIVGGRDPVGPRGLPPHPRPSGGVAVDRGSGRLRRDTSGLRARLGPRRSSAAHLEAPRRRPAAQDRRRRAPDAFRSRGLVP